MLPLQDVPLSSLPSPFHSSGCPVVCKIAEQMCDSIKDEQCKPKVKEVTAGELSLADFLSYMREQYGSEKVESAYVKAITNIFKPRNSIKKRDEGD